MVFTRIVNLLARTYNKGLMTFLGVVIFAILINKSFSPSEFHLSSTSGVFLLIIWGLFTLISLFYTLNGVMLNLSFNKTVHNYEAEGKPIRGIRGFDDLMAELKVTRNTSVLITVASALSLSLFIVSVTTSFASDNLASLIMTIGLTFAFITISVIFLVEYPEETSFSPGGLIGFYEPDVYPMTLDNILSDVFITYLDPVTYMEIDEWTLDIQNKLSDTFEADEDMPTRVERAREKILLLTYLNANNPFVMPMNVLEDEIAELMGKDNVQPFLNGDETGLSYSEIKRMVIRMEKMAPEVFRLIDRLMIELTDNYDSFTKKDLYFTVAAITNQGSIIESASSLAFFLNNTERTDRKINVSLLSGMDHIHPYHQEITITLDPQTDKYPESKPPVISASETDALELLTSILQVGDAVWFRFKPTNFGYKVVTIQAEEEGGKAYGKSLEMKFTKSIGFYIKAYLPKISGLAGVALPAIRGFLGI